MYLINMVKQHSYSFFGQNTGLIVNSPSDSDPFFFMRCIKRKSDGNWEKPSIGEGKVIKISLEESIMILDVLNRKNLNWTGFHTFNDDKTQISFGWEDKTTKTLWIKIANYSKMLNYAQADILRRLLDHFLKEKIKKATIMNNNNKNERDQQERHSNTFSNRKNNDPRNIKDDNNIKSKNEDIVLNDNIENDLNKELRQLNGVIQGETDKALLINFNSGQEIWIPKSTIHGKYTPRKNFEQEFLIDDWILKRNQIIS